MIDELFEEYIECMAGAAADERHNEWRRISAEVESKMLEGTLTNEDLALYEQVVARAAFWAGFQTATQANVC